jgi:hypothetical protein
MEVAIDCASLAPLWGRREWGFKLIVLPQSDPAKAYDDVKVFARPRRKALGYTRAIHFARNAQVTGQTQGGAKNCPLQLRPSRAAHPGTIACTRPIKLAPCM